MIRRYWLRLRRWWLLFRVQRCVRAALQPYVGQPNTPETRVRMADDIAEALTLFGRELVPASACLHCNLVFLPAARDARPKTKCDQCGEPTMMPGPLEEGR